MSGYKWPVSYLGCPSLDVDTPLTIFQFFGMLLLLCTVLKATSGAEMTLSKSVRMYAICCQSLFNHSER